MMIHYKPLAAVVLSLALGACASVGPPPQENYYRLPSLPVTAVKNGPLLKGTLLIDQVTADELHSDTAMLYSEDPQGLQLHRYSYQHWQDSPPNLVATSLQRQLSDAGIAGNVVLNEAGETPAWVLNVRLDRFEQWSGKDRHSVMVEMALQLKDDQQRQTVLNENYAKTVNMPDSEPLTSVGGYREALRQVVESFLADLARKAH